MSARKEYTLKINGVTQSIKEVTNLKDVLFSVESAINKANSSFISASKTNKEYTRAILDEEKAEKKLGETIGKVAHVKSEENRRQLEANQALREATREAARRVQISQLEEGSIKRLGMELTDLRNEYYSLSESKRLDTEIGGKMLEQIQAMDAQYKSAKESAGQFQDSVGNYGKATEGLSKVSTSIEGVTKTTQGLAQGLLGGISLMALFGDQSEEDAKSARELQKVIALLSIVQQVNTNILKEGLVQNKLAAVTDGVRTVQLRAKTAAETLSTKGTIAATAAQKIFNVVASANPYVILAIALIGVASALVMFSDKTEDATEKQKKLNAEQGAYLDRLEEESNRIRETGDRRVADLERQIRVLEAQGGKEKEIRDIEDQIAREREKNNNYLRGYYADEIKNLDANKAKLEQYRDVLLRLQEAKARGNNKLEIDIDLNGSAEKVNVEDAINAIQGKVDNLGRTIKLAVELTTEKEDLSAEAKIREATRVKADRAAGKSAAQTARERAKAELDALRAAEDAKLRTLLDEQEKARRQLIIGFDRQIEDLKNKLSTESNLTIKAKAALNEQILSLELEKTQSLNKLQNEQAKAQAEAELDLARTLEDSRTALILGAFDRRQTEINIRYDRQIEDLKKRLEEDKTLTATAQTYISQLILNAEEQRQREIAEIKAQAADKNAALELSKLESALSEAKAKIGEVKVRESMGLQLFDISATKENIDATIQALSVYVEKVRAYQNELTAAHEKTLATIKEGTPEYEEEVLKYSAAMQASGKAIKEALVEIDVNTQKSGDLLVDYLKDLFEKISDYAEAGLIAIDSELSTFSLGLQVQLDDLNAGLSIINDKYEEAKTIREDSTAHIEQLEADLRAATGNTAEALKQQLQDEMHIRAEAEREEARLAREKERRETEIAKKERQMKRVDLIGNIASAIANTAQGVTKALSLMWPLNFIVGGLVGSFGAFQVGIMTRQLSKLGDGGFIDGPSHSQGGVRIPGTNIEVEGKEFVINKASTAANLELIEFINAAKGPVSLSDVIGVLPGQNTPTIINEVARNTDDRVIDAINGINIRPVVSVVEVIDAMDTVTSVRDLAGA